MLDIKMEKLVSNLLVMAMAKIVKGKEQSLGTKIKNLVHLSCACEGKTTH